MWALIVDGQVQEMTDTDPVGRFHPELTWVAATSDTHPGDFWNGSAFARPLANAPGVPRSVSKVQAVLALHRAPGAGAGKTMLDDIEATIAAASDPQIGLAWNNASEIDRNGLFSTQIAKSPPLNMTDAQLDDLFTVASKIVV